MLSAVTLTVFFNEIYEIKTVHFFKRENIYYMYHSKFRFMLELVLIVKFQIYTHYKTNTTLSIVGKRNTL